ncbi:MAG: hypothetical protein O7G88_23075 [bacterium]|nr:hypothetical protein [bacterium]
MIYRERSDAELYDDHLRDIVLKRHSPVGPWLVMGLGAALALFLCYLVFSNIIRPAPVAASHERSLRMMTETPSLPRATPDWPAALAMPWRSAATSVPQSRATNALVGGEGPALLPTSLSMIQRARPHETH